VDVKVSSELKDLSCKGSLAVGEAHYFTGVMYQSRDRVVNKKSLRKSPHPQKTEGGAPADPGGHQSTMETISLIRCLWLDRNPWGAGTSVRILGKDGPVC
jgi:hypothetical protein